MFSWEALEEPERRLLGRLTVFNGGASLQAAEAVCGDALGGRLESLLCSLLDSSFLLRLDSGHDAQLRVGMLDAVRQLAAEHAAAREDVTALERRHANYFLSYCEHAVEQAARTDQRGSLELLESERANVRVAFDRLLAAGATDEALRLAIAFARALPWDSDTDEVRGWLARALTALLAPTATVHASDLCWDGTLPLDVFGDAEEQLIAELEPGNEAQDPPAEAVVPAGWRGEWASHLPVIWPGGVRPPWARPVASARRTPS